MPSYPYEPGCESRTDSLLTPGMDNTRHFYSITAVAGTVWMEPSISIPKPRLCAPLWLSGAEVGMEMKDAKEVETSSPTQLLQSNRRVEQKLSL